MAVYYCDAIMGAMTSLITNLMSVYSTVHSGADQRKHLRLTGFCAGDSPGTGEFSAQMASNAENVSIWWRNHGLSPELGVIPLLWRQITLRGFGEKWKHYLSSHKYGLSSKWP